ncbi:LysR family transcriptional regulator [Erwinia sp. CPCC 100877]|nr:LysR family transcriptional regulator [Erwinia sp. CPCC 100877]
MSRKNIADLIIFKTIYGVKSLNKTAQLLGYTQSNITARLKAIESDCQTIFFTRSHPGVTATTNGEKCIPLLYVHFLKWKH